MIHHVDAHERGLVKTSVLWSKVVSIELIEQPVCSVVSRVWNVGYGAHHRDRCYVLLNKLRDLPVPRVFGIWETTRGNTNVLRALREVSIRVLRWEILLESPASEGTILCTSRLPLSFLEALSPLERIASSKATTLIRSRRLAWKPLTGFHRFSRSKLVVLISMVVRPRIFRVCEL